jgi:hypothetical protein
MDAIKVNERITDVTSALLSKIVDQELKIMVLSDLLVENGMLTVDDLERRYKIIQDRDYDKLISEITTLIRDFESKKL